MYNLPEYLKSCQSYGSSWSADLICLTCQKHVYCFLFIICLYVLSKNVVQVTLESCLSCVILHFGHNTSALCLGIVNTLGQFFKTSPFASISFVPNLHQILFMCELILQKPPTSTKQKFELAIDGICCNLIGKSFRNVANKMYQYPSQVHIFFILQVFRR